MMSKQKDGTIVIIDGDFGPLLFSQILARPRGPPGQPILLMSLWAVPTGCPCV